MGGLTVAKPQKLAVNNSFRKLESMADVTDFTVEKNFFWQGTKTGSTLCYRQRFRSC